MLMDPMIQVGMIALYSEQNYAGEHYRIKDNRLNDCVVQFAKAALVVGSARAYLLKTYVSLYEYVPFVILACRP